MALYKKGGLLGEILKRKKVISQEEFEEGFRLRSLNGKRLGQALIDLGYVGEEEVLKALSEQFDLSIIKLSEHSIDPSVIARFPSRFAVRYKLVPFKMTNNTLTIVTSDPLNIHILEEIGLLLNCKVEMALSGQIEIEEAIKKYYGPGKETVDTIVSNIAEGELKEERDGTHRLESLANEAPVIRLVNLIISEAIKRKASDIHIEPFENGMVVRYRVDGVLYDTTPPPKHLYSAIISRIKIMAELDIAERRLPQDGRIQLKLGNKEIDLRIATLPTLYGESMVIRILDKEGILFGLEELGFSKEIFNQYKRLITRPNGIILVTGPTGSGKTTTLYASLNRINSPEKKIITIEDPVEYQLDRINQLPVKPKINLTFANGLRSMLRQDPDIMMVGEIRDLETAEVAVQAALTGHLIFSTLHTNDAPSAITRLLDMGVESYLVASSIIGILAQRLVRLNCPNCKEEYIPEAGLIKETGSDPEETKGLKFWRGRGCVECNQIGYKGRTGIYELLILNDELRELILQKTNASIIRQRAVQLGMSTLRDNGWQKVGVGTTTLEELLRVTREDEGS